MRVVFFGTPDFAAEVLRFLQEKGVDIVALVSKPDKPKGRGLALVETAVKKQAALTPSIPFFQPEIASDPQFIKTLEAIRPDLFAVVAYGEIMKESLLQVAKVAAINLHTSPLPKYRGAAPIQRAIMGGESLTGVTIIHMAKKMDAGDILLQREVAIDPEETFGDLEKKLLDVGKEALFDAIRLLERGESSRTPQDESQATFAPKVELEECEIRLRDQTADTIHNLVRGTNPEPGAFCWITCNGEKKRLKITSAKKHSLSGPPGTFLSWGKGGLIVAAKEGAIEFLELQLEGKKRLSADLFMRGLRQEAIVW